ncbi:galactosyl transferase GMA12/MNN10 domain protein [Burkholderia territorii]|uniref:galactosyl transferase GMA12/MNN10 domain protein n=1 Tax=Burkholderia territorii TaxID=1503055 RepID=UPI0007563FE3|nr:galactosyl transferase GMA12/MNN10 domain protein [Burkholderia territorii]KWA08217.1 galactosyl transferase GMA12/MNN10 domain protein [Burkholderia territorii]
MIVLSHFYQKASATLANHRRYARMRGYRHDVVDASVMPREVPLCWQYRYETLLNTLRHAQEGELVLMLSESAVILRPEDTLESFIGADNSLLVCTAAHNLPQVDVQIWRNTEEIRRVVYEIVKRCRLGGEPIASEAHLLADLPTHHYTTTTDGICPVMQAGPNFDPLWSRIPTFAVSIDDQPQRPERKHITARYRDILVAHINEHQASGLPMFHFPQYLTDNAERSVYNPGKSVALVTLHTPNIAIYGRIAEHNFSRYCDRHGYTLYVHRDIPQEIGMGKRVTGNWIKPWLLHGYLHHHDWVIWLDADVLIADQARPLEPLLDKSDYLLAHDIGKWQFNAGIVGLPRTSQNETMLRDLMRDIVNLSDRSSVYASNGDQHHLIEAMTRANLLDEGTVLDFISVNTPWMFRRPDSFMVHYFGMWPEMRAMMMAHDDLLLSGDS